jgi:hypothetical protein
MTCLVDAVVEEAGCDTLRRLVGPHVWRQHLWCVSVCVYVCGGGGVMID